MKRSLPLYLLLLATLAAFQVSGAERGIGVTLRPQQGEPFRLYEDSYALVIGNGRYTKGWDPLPGALQDADDVAAALKRNGFSVTLKKDLTKSAFNTALSEFSTKFGAEPDNRLLFYYAGHGYTQKLSTDEELGFLVMVDAPAPERDPVGFRLASVDMQSMVTEARIMNAKHALFMFDSCFSGSILNLRERVVPQTVSDNVKYPVRQFITAGRANEPVPDHSVFKQAFLNLLEGREPEPIPDGYITGEELGLFLKNKVPEYNPAQHPQYGKIRDPKLDQGDFVFMAGGSAVITQPAPPSASEPLTGSLYVETSPRGALVYVNGGRVGASPVSLSDLSPGRVEVLANLEGYKYGKESVWIQAGKETRVTLLLEPVPTTGTLRVTSDPSGARWYLDGAYVGTTPGAMSEVAAGSHKVALKLEEHRDWEETVSVRVGEEANVRASLTPVPPKPVPSAGNTGKTLVDRIAGEEFKFAYVPPGTFTMGSPSNEPGRSSNETQHQVTLTQGYYLQTTEVTQGQWKAVMGSNPSNFKNCGDDCPVENISWNDCQSFIQKLNRLAGGDRYRLPTEAEWEYAARAGTTTPFAFGDCLSTDEANYNGNYPLSGCSKGEYRKMTVRTGSLSANAWGLHDMHGNVWEWCQDWYGDYPSGSVTDPTGPSSGSLRVLRGGGWICIARYCRSADRSGNTPVNSFDGLGARLLRSYP